MIFQQTLKINTPGHGAIEITDTVVNAVSTAGIRQGLCNVFLCHTSASLMICENADPQVLRDLEAFLSRLVPDGDSLFRHTAEGSDDMPAHIQSVLTQTSLNIPIANARVMLGTWQGVYLYEHRRQGHPRQVCIGVYGE